jgi:hypothetical protein
MIMAQEKAFLKAQSQLQAICELVRRAPAEAKRIDEVERETFSQLLALGLTLLEALVAAQGDGDAGEVLESEGRTVRRLPVPRERRYLSIFGELFIKRYVYAQREGQRIERAPLDEELGLPEDEFSYVLEDWLQRLCVKESFSEAVTSLRALLGIAPSAGSTEHMNQRMAEHAEAFRLSQSVPSAEEDANILVATADGKGVPMRRPLEERVRGSKRRGKGEKANKKQMAYVGAVYSINPFVRSADDVVDELRRRQRAPDRPIPQHKHVWAEMTRVLEGEECNGKERLFAQMALEVDDRDPERKKTLVCLMDGEAALWQVQRGWLRRAVGILDLFHVLERLWAVAHCLYAEKSPEAEEFVTRRLRMLLDGKVGHVIAGLRRLRDQHDLKGEKRRTVNAAIGYYTNNREYMRYDRYLAAGYPIGSGVAEGACRHVVKDRMEQTGMRWTLEGAQAMLHVRAIYLNGDWDAFVTYRIDTEQRRLYGRRAA